MKRVVISDTHIGSKYYQSERLVNFLKSIEYDQLILAGDIIDFIRVPVFTERVLEMINALNYSKEIIYIVGNHDTPLTGFIGKEIFGIKFLSEYEFEENGKTFRIEHGDAYDDQGFIHNEIIMSFISVAQNCIEHWFDISLSDIVTDWRLKRRSFRSIWDILDINNDVDYFICGHYHVPEIISWTSLGKKSHTYINSGDWVQHTSYVIIKDGEPELKEYDGVGIE